MKLWNIALSVKITTAGELTGYPSGDPETCQEAISEIKPGSDPMLTQAKILDTYLRKMAPTVSPPVFAYGQEPGVSMADSTQVGADTFEELQRIISRFHALLTEIGQPVKLE